jgi:hypothetical protein
MSNVIQFRGVTRLDLDPDATLEGCKGQLDRFVLIGYDKDGEWFFSSTMGDGGDVLWLLEILKQKLISGDYE